MWFAVVFITQFIPFTPETCSRSASRRSRGRPGFPSLLARKKDLPVPEKVLSWWSEDLSSDLDARDRCDRSERWRSRRSGPVGQTDGVHVDVGVIGRNVGVRCCDADRPEPSASVVDPDHLRGGIARISVGDDRMSGCPRGDPDKHRPRRVDLDLDGIEQEPGASRLEARDGRGVSFRLRIGDPQGRVCRGCYTCRSAARGPDLRADGVDHARDVGVRGRVVDVVVGCSGDEVRIGRLTIVVSVDHRKPGRHAPELARSTRICVRCVVLVARDPAAAHAGASSRNEGIRNGVCRGVGAKKTENSGARIGCQPLGVELVLALLEFTGRLLRFRSGDLGHERIVVDVGTCAIVERCDMAVVIGYRLIERREVVEFSAVRCAAAVAVAELGVELGIEEFEVGAPLGRRDRYRYVVAVEVDDDPSAVRIAVTRDLVFLIGNHVPVGEVCMLDRDVWVARAPALIDERTAVDIGLSDGVADLVRRVHLCERQIGWEAGGDNARQGNEFLCHE